MIYFRRQKESYSFRNEIGSECRIGKNPCRYRELVGSGICRAVVSEENAGGRAAGLVRATLRNGRGELNVLFGAGRADGGTLVRQHAGELHIRCEAAPTSLAPFRECEAVAAGVAAGRGDGRERQSETYAAD